MKPLSTKILYIIGSLDTGGAERHLLQTLPLLDRTLFQPEIFCLSKRGVLADDIETRGVPVHCPPWVPNIPNTSIALRFYKALLSAFFLWRHLLRHRPSIVHFFLPQAYILGGITSLFAGCKRRIMSRRSLNDYQKNHPFLTRLEKNFLHPRMDAVLGNSKAVAAQLAKEGITLDRLGLIYNGIDMTPFKTPINRQNVRARLGIPLDCLTLIKVANLIPYKGHSDLLRALPSLEGNWRLVCVGRDDGIQGSLEKEALQLGIHDKVIFAGSRPDVADLLKASDIGVLASHQEGFSNALLEYMAAGLAIVATDVGGNAEALADSGIIVPASDPASLSQALRKLQSSVTRARLGEAAQKRIANFSLERCVTLYEELYNHILQQKKLPLDILFRPSTESRSTSF